MNDSLVSILRAIRSNIIRGACFLGSIVILDHRWDLDNLFGLNGFREDSWGSELMRLNIAPPVIILTLSIAGGLLGRLQNTVSRPKFMGNPDWRTYLQEARTSLIQDARFPQSTPENPAPKARFTPGYNPGVHYLSVELYEDRKQEESEYENRQTLFWLGLPLLASFEAREWSWVVIFLVAIILLRLDTWLVERKLKRHHEQFIDKVLRGLASGSSLVNATMFVEKWMLFNAGAEFNAKGPALGDALAKYSERNDPGFVEELERLSKEHLGGDPPPHNSEYTSLA